MGKRGRHRRSVWRHRDGRLKPPSYVAILGAVAVLAGGAIGLTVANVRDQPSPNYVANYTPPPMPTREAMTIETLVTEGDNASTILVPSKTNGTIVIYAHGNGQTDAELTAGRNIAPVAEALARSGYIVGAPLAAGNGWGNPATVQAYVDFANSLTATYGGSSIVWLTESMGNLGAMQAAPLVPNSRGMFAVYPVCDLRTMESNPIYAASVAAAWGDGNKSVVSPVTVPRLPLRIWASPDDTRVPFDSNAAVCAAQAEADGLDVKMKRTRGDHGDASNFNTGEISAFFDSLRG